MKLVEFDSRQFGDDVAAIVERQGYGAVNRAIRATGISHATFYRLLDGPPPKGIDTIIAAAAYFNLSLKKYFRHG